MVYLSLLRAPLARSLFCTPANFAPSSLATSAQGSRIAITTTMVGKGLVVGVIAAAMARGAVAQVPARPPTYVMNRSTIIM